MELALSPKPIPATPTHCTGCGSELEPLRRWGGKCKQCVRGRGEPKQVAAAEPCINRWHVIRRFTQVRPNGVRERFVRVRCTTPIGDGICGSERNMSQSKFDGSECEGHRSLACRRCKLKNIKARGVDRDYTVRGGAENFIEGLPH